MTEKGDRWRLWVTWLALLAVLGLFAGVQIPLNETQAAAWAAFQKRFAIDDHAAVSLQNQLARLAYRGPIRRTSIPLDEVEQALNGGRPLARDRDKDRVWWNCPDCGGKTALGVIAWEGPIIDATRVFRRTEFTRDRPNRSAAYEAVLLIRRTTYAGGYALWTLIFIVFLSSFRAMKRRQRLWWCNLLLLIATAAVGLSLIGPQYWQAARRFVDDDAAGIGLIELGTSLALLLVMLRYRKPADPVPRCRECGYNLTANTSGRCPECGAAIVGRISS